METRSRTGSARATLPATSLVRTAIGALVEVLAIPAATATRSGVGGRPAVGGWISTGKGSPLDLEGHLS